MQTVTTSIAAPAFLVMFIHESGYIESYRAAEIRAAPDTFRSILAEHRGAGRKPLVMRAATKPA